MKIEDIEKVVRDCLPDASAAVHPDAHLFDQLGVDSVAFIQLVVALEEACNIAFRDEDLDRKNFATPTAILALVKSYRP